MKISDIIIPDTREKLGAMSLNSLRRLCLSLKLDFYRKKKAQLIERLCNQLHIVQDDEEDTQTECQDEENRSDRSSFKSLPVGRSTGRKKRKRKPNKEKSKKRKKPNKEKSKTKKRKMPSTPHKITLTQPQPSRIQPSRIQPSLVSHSHNGNMNRQ